MRVLIVLGMFVALALGGGGLWTGINASNTAANNSAVATHEIRLLLAQQEFDHTQTQNGQKELNLVVKDVEAHLDNTIRSSIANTALSTLKELGK